MAKPKVKKITLITARADMETVLREIILLGCIEVTEPSGFGDDPELNAHVTRETADLSVLGADQDQIPLLGTEYTLILTGWLAVRMEPVLVSKIKDYNCAWETDDPVTDDNEDSPIILRFPQLFTKCRSKGHRLFTPLKPATGLEAETKDTQNPAQDPPQDPPQDSPQDLQDPPQESEEDQ